MEETNWRSVAVSIPATHTKHHFTFKDQTTIAEMKDELCRVTGAPVDYMKISFRGSLVNDLKTIGSVESDENSPILNFVLPSLVTTPSKGISKEITFDLSYSLDGGCPSEGWICCDCCGMTAICRPCECIDRCFCFFVGCDVTDCNAIQCFCWRCYCCASGEQKAKATT
jgi:hypothetical protein